MNTSRTHANNPSLAKNPWEQNTMQAWQFLRAGRTPTLSLTPIHMRAKPLKAVSTTISWIAALTFREFRPDSVQQWLQSPNASTSESPLGHLLQLSGCALYGTFVCPSLVEPPVMPPFRLEAWHVSYYLPATKACMQVIFLLSLPRSSIAHY